MNHFKFGHGEVTCCIGNAKDRRALWRYDSSANSRAGRSVDYASNENVKGGPIMDRLFSVYLGEILFSTKQHPDHKTDRSEIRIVWPGFCRAYSFASSTISRGSFSVILYFIARPRERFFREYPRLIGNVLEPLWLLICVHFYFS
jgi:hypothetical protein